MSASDPQRFWPRVLRPLGLGSVVLLGAAACEARCGGAPVTTDPPPVAVVAPVDELELEPAESTLRTVRITADDVQEIEHRELRIVDAPPYERRKVGKPIVLAKGDYMRFPLFPWPLSSTRGFVIIQEGPEYTAPIVEARLLDLETGEVLTTLHRVYFTAYTKLGVARGVAEIEGTLHEVLVHGSDGQIVPLWPEGGERRRWVEINAGTGDAWVFAEDERSEEAEETAPSYRYAYWPDLRKPPPEATELFPGQVDFSEERPPPPGWLGPTARNPVAAPLFVARKTRDDDECPKVELRPEGHRCAGWGTWAMAMDGGRSSMTGWSCWMKS